ncbi:MAG: PIG-L family deacetylase [Chloroflexi bacterium]|nr:MAG: PIG-L family deacetylase [Chloroflexota bacterium]
MAPRKLFAGPDDRRIKRALCIVAHPDDIEFYCGGTVLKMTSRGVLVDFVLATSGDKGARDVSKSRAKMARIREREQIRSRDSRVEAGCAADLRPQCRLSVSPRSPGSRTCGD